ncbi:uncharacterized protein LOC128896586 [Hylaeus anthracinus]|uniref:uncharacterized protein LOC128896586 n=1 Tax=Hylaeus anthracinus TaxID=313031 RepID=UPI0023B8CFB1|nr:uncharacterized protein LOC128896586 [Hylaeus anthracinus]XP_054015929.1 uncharacterized protein LOC128896586 [Hylaeus anthracinus]
MRKWAGVNTSKSSILFDIAARGREFKYASMRQRSVPISSWSPKMWSSWGYKLPFHSINGDSISEIWVVDCCSERLVEFLVCSLKGGAIIGVKERRHSSSGYKTVECGNECGGGIIIHQFEVNRLAGKFPMSSLGASALSRVHGTQLYNTARIVALALSIQNSVLSLARVNNGPACKFCN